MLLDVPLIAYTSAMQVVQMGTLALWTPISNGNESIYAEQ